MSGFLIDTNVISEILKPNPDSNVAAWSRAKPKVGLFLSVVSLGELRKGLTILPAGRKGDGALFSGQPARILI